MSMHIYSIPECSTDEETFNEYETTRHGVIIDVNLSKAPSYASLIVDDTISDSEHPNTVNELSSSNIDNSKCKEDTSDNGSLEHDKEKPFANSTSPDVNIKKVSSPYLKIEDYSSNSNETSTTEKNPLPTSDLLKSPPEKNFNLKASDNTGKADRPYGDLRKNLGISSSTSELSTIKHKQVQQLQAHQQGSPSSRDRSGSLQWVQNIYKNLLDFRRPSAIADEQIRKSNEEIEMDHSDEESSKASLQQQTHQGGRRFSENVIGKQKRFPFSSGLGHLREKWRERHVNKKQEIKDYDQIRPDVCPLFTFPKKYDEDEVILDTLRQAIRKCTAVDPTVRPTSTSVLDQLSQITLQ